MGSKILNVPYKCQNDPDANLKRTDCGPCCIAMILGGIGQQATTNAVVAAANQQGDHGLMQSQVINAARAFGLAMDWSQGFTLDGLKHLIDNGQPPIALVKYANLPERVDKGSTGGHYVVVVGYDDDTQRIFINDPDYFPGTSGGFQKAYAYQTWMSAWGGFAMGENANFSLIFPTKAGLIGGSGSGAPTSTPQPIGQSTGEVFVTAASGLRLRAQPSRSGAELGAVIFGQKLTALGTEGAPDAEGIAWQQVRTEAGVVGFVAAQQGTDRYLNKGKSAEPYVVQVIDAQPIREAGGLALRPDRNLALNPIDRAQAGERLTVFERVIEGNTPWLRAQSARNQIGWVRETSQGQLLVTKITPDLSGAAGTGATPEPPRKDPPPTVTTTEVFVSTSDGLNLRKEQSTTSEVLIVVPFGTQLTTIGPTVGPDAKGIVWQQVRTAQNQMGWVAVKIGANATVTTSAPTPVEVTNAVPWGKCLAGLGMGNPQPLTAGQLRLIADAKLEAFKVLTLPDPGENQRLIAQLKKIRSDLLIVARLFFSVDVNSKTKFSPQNFVDFCMNGLTGCYQAGVRYFEVHNEPNLEIEGMNWNWANGGEFGNWLTQVLHLLRPRFPEAKWGYPGLSPQPNVDAFLDGSAAAANACDWIGVHCYWQQPPNQPPFPMNGDNAGFYWRAKFKPRFANKLLMITEFSNNSPAVSANDKGTHYADYIKLLRTEPNIGAAFGFALNWPGQDHNQEGWEGSGIPGSFLARANSVGALT
ncbi:hypothetical protein TFLX_03623 [Thermoflexales bacterium]|nr:hypothetical protein TFLX_03623 [Thermoflexales bacterium]